MMLIVEARECEERRDDEEEEDEERCTKDAKWVADDRP